jgi:hypothetical protein
MTTQWRNKEGFKEKETQEFISTPTQFANVPMFEVLHSSANAPLANAPLANAPLANAPSENIKESFMNKPNVIEGFDMFGYAYYKDVPKLTSGLKGLSDVGTKIRELLAKITDPINQLDKNFEDTFVYLLQSYFMNPCLINTDKQIVIGHTAGAATDFTWIDRNFPGLIDGFTTMKEGFSLIDENQLNNTLYSLAANHPDISFDDIKRLYVEKLTKYYVDLSNNVTANQLFLFNNNFDNTVLSDPNVKKTIPTPSPGPDVEPYVVRFDIKDTKHTISYYEFNYKYFPIPNDALYNDSKKTYFTLENFNQTVYNNNTKYQNEVNNNDFPLTSFTTALIGPNTKDKTVKNIDPNSLKTPIDLKYMFSIHRKQSLKNSTISNYLDYIIKLLSFIVFKNKLSTGDTKATYKEILSRVGTVYINCINHIESAKYASKYTYLTADEIAMFNHLFFCCLTNYTDVPYGLIDTTMSSLILNLNKYIYINLKSAGYTGYTDTGTGNFVELPSDKMYYSYDSYTETTDRTALYDFIIDDGKNKQNLAIQDFYFFQECDIENANKLNLLRNCAKIIKDEIYRVLCIPIVVYLVYNFYYLFYFKDCYDETKVGNEYKDQCKDCYNPIFPDWERAFHKMEKHNTDYFLEFIFKPTKLLSSLLNGAKAAFRKPGIFGIDITGDGTVLKDKYPYVFFLLTFAIIYTIIINHGKMLLNILTGFFKFDIPNITVPGSTFGTSTIAMISVWISFIIILIKRLPISAAWIMSGPGGLGMIAKAICSFIYWLGKGLITSMIIPFSVLICAVYLFWIGLFGVLNYTDNAHSYADKTEMIDRVIYTSLYTESKGPFGVVIFGLKSIAFFCVYFLTEIVILFTTLTSSIELGKMQPRSKNVKPYETDDTLTKIQSFMKIIYTIAFFLLALWCYYKYRMKIPKMNGFYTSLSKTTPGAINKTLNMTCENDDIKLTSDTFTANKDTPEKNAEYYNKLYNENKTNAFNTFYKADDMNSGFLDYYENKTGNIKRRPLVTKIMNKLSSFGESLSKTFSGDVIDNSFLNKRLVNVKNIRNRIFNNGSEDQNILMPDKTGGPQRSTEPGFISKNFGEEIQAFTSGNSNIIEKLTSKNPLNMFTNKDGIFNKSARLLSGVTSGSKGTYMPEALKSGPAAAVASVLGK